MNENKKKSYRGSNQIEWIRACLHLMDLANSLTHLRCGPTGSPADDSEPDSLQTTSLTPLASRPLAVPTTVPALSVPTRYGSS